MEEEISKLGTMGLLDAGLKREERLAIAAAQCAAQIMAEVAPKMYGLDNTWPKQMGDGAAQIAQNIYRFLNDRENWAPK